MKIKQVKGKSGIEYNFVKIGKAYLSDTPLKKKNGELPKFNKENLTWFLKLELLVDEEILNAEQSCYLILDEDQIIYVGYYSNSFRDRWWRKNGYFWHSDKVDNKVNELLTKNPNKNISVWLSINPYVDTIIEEIKINVNISKFIEDDIIMSCSKELLLNTVGINLENDKKHTKSVAQILCINDIK